ncbi:MAG: NADH-quinone oxidoreductase subunit L [Agathobacter sp.]|uniref:NADH-quinone oxidoreductase subunit 5 family protein n=1 Tax=Agathobacter sp. TaxID=2021311 RepID=UPI0025807829|nr:proton-conducting transporter membrane subunit [Agathobacter sp.]MBQ1681866.1 NADH-quinone oxidoreductase subunit L [Agathobacter sp.]
MDKLVTILICLPFVMAVLPAIIKNSKARAAVVYLCGAIVMALSVFTAVKWAMAGGKAMDFNLPYTEVFDKIILVGDFLLMFLIIYLSFKWKKGIISFLSIIQTLLVAGIELFGPEVEEKAVIHMDWLTFIMILIIGIIGVAIGIYAVGYMHGYHIHHHKELKDRRSFFLAMIFVFYGAMFGLVLSQSLIWLYFFWEITSVTSFLLIGYTRSEEAINNSFKALWMNLLGGLGIAVAIAYAIMVQGTANLYDVISLAGAHNAAKGALIPIAMLAFAALTKSAQFPFSGWLLGAMVAPTPSSALLHSATMVKAGVYLLLRLAVVMNNNYVGQMVYLVGGFTFLAASCLAITVSDGKKVLAYSTISNLGLIVACAGAGYQETVWAAVFLIIFHAVSKSMLFQCVGAIENTTGSRDIEDMQGLIMRFPKLAFILMIGIAGMFLAPFGMLVSKWAALKAFVDARSALMILFVVFGSATTMFYWTKWFAKILGVNPNKSRDLTKPNEYISMFFHAILLVALCVCFPLVSKYVVLPLTGEMYGNASAVISQGNIIVMVIMIVALLVIPTFCYLLTRNAGVKEVMAYMGGDNAGDNVRFLDSVGEPKELQVSNWYMEDVFGEKKLFTPSVIISTLIILVLLCTIVGGAF